MIDPFGRITGCDGEILPNYRGFSVALYRPLPGDNTGELGRLLSLPQTEVPDVSNNNIPGGLEPNDQNSNPFFSQKNLIVQEQYSERSNLVEVLIIRLTTIAAVSYLLIRF